MEDNFINDYWLKNPLVVKRFLENQSTYKQLCFEVEIYIKNLLDKNKIKYAFLTARDKTLNSFIEKIERKKYNDPFKEIDDFAGVRVVALYKDEIPTIEKLIENEFKIIKKIDRNNDLEIDHFGYEAIHYVLKLGSKCKGVRYDSLKKLKCEVQVRTILQDAWANVAHHLTYKREKDIPKILQRKLNRLVGLFETADEQFYVIKNEREQYLAEIESNPNKILNEEINLDSLKEYLILKFPNLKISEHHIQHTLDTKSFSKYKIIKEIDTILNNSTKAIEEYQKKIGNPLMASYSSTLLNVGIATQNKDYFENHPLGYGEIAKEIIIEHKKW